MKEDFKRTHSVEFNQASNESATGKETASDSASRSQQATVARDLGSTQTTARTSNEKANVAFEIRFTVPLGNKYPTNQSCPP